MSKTSAVFAAMLIIAAPLAAQTITVVSPNGGETLTKGGSPFAIAWTVRNVDQNVKIVLLREDGERFGLIAEGLAPGSSPYSWTVGETRSGEAPAGDYKIRVVSADGTVKDASDAFFAIAGGGGSTVPGTRPTLTVTSPRAGEIYVEGSPMTIAWSASGFEAGEDLHIYLTRSSLDHLIGIRVVDVSDGTLSLSTPATGDPPAAGVSEPADYRFVLRCGAVRAESGSFGVTRIPHCDLVVSDPYLEQRSSGKGFRVKVTDLRGDFNGWVVLQHYTMGMGLGNAVKERRRLELRRGVPATVNLANVRGSLFDNKCDVTFRFDVNPDREVAESNYDNNVTSKKFCWERGTDGRFFSLRLGPNYITPCEACSVVIRPGDVNSIDGDRVGIRLEITLQNCGSTAIRGGRLMIVESWDGERSARSLREVRNIDIEPGHFKLLYETVNLERHASNGLHFSFNCGESGALDANNKFHFHPNFIGF